MLTIALLSTCSVTAYAAADFSFKGGLVQEPCMLAPNSSDIFIDFGSVINKFLYRYQRTAGIPITLILQGCDTSATDKLSITFKATEDAQQAGMIMLDPSSTAKGIAIGVEEKGIFIPINKSVEKNFHSGDNKMVFDLFLSADNESIKNNALHPGTINANAILELEYH
ncbi:fimbrial protein [Pantoea sp. DY-5]|uniref:fimbrial protein n=1 Tax=Pantoea sp. DY-5 TaxID=2871488 RepID=UPI0021030225|nr:fimbrial protein [Pantoea sp. DY-5]